MSDEPPARGTFLHPRRLLKIRTRGRWGVQAGLLAGMAVAAIFFAIDLLRAAPLSTPLFLSHSMLQALVELDSDGLARRVADHSPGSRLAALTAVHLTLFAILGVVAAALSNLFHVRWSPRTSAVAGFLVGLGVWLGASRVGPVWLTEAYLTPEIVMGSGIVGGAVLGWHLRLCRIDAEESRDQAAR